MSVDDDVELRDLLAQTLDSNGCMAKIRAQLRASIFLALDEDIKVSKKEPLLNNKLKTYLDTIEGQAMFCIVREFLEFFNLHFTISVYEPESYLGNGYKYEGRHKIIKDLGLNLDENTKVPLLLQLIKIAQIKTKSTIEINLNVNNTTVKESSNSHDDNSTSNIKTESNHNSITSNGSNSFPENLPQQPQSEDNDQNALNASGKNNKTFDVSNPTIEHESTVTNVYKDDTYDDTSSIAEDSVAANLEKRSEGTNGDDFSPPILMKSDISEKSKSQKSDKLKTKTLDLPPLQINKSRANDILPSLYSKEFKEKSNLRELDKMFDMEQDYEEDFMCSGDLDLSLKSSSNHVLDESPGSPSASSVTDKSAKFVVSSKNNNEMKGNKKNNNSCNKPIFQPIVNLRINATDNGNTVDVDNNSNVSD